MAVATTKALLTLALLTVLAVLRVLAPDKVFDIEIPEVGVFLVP